jgi:tRNA(Ile)-lysidine synthase
LRADLEARAIPYVSDRSNDDLRVPRNRVRAELIPRLKEHFNPSIVDVLADEAAVAQEEWRWLDAAASEAAARLCRFQDLVCRIDAEALNRLPVAVGRLVARRALTAAAGERPISFDHVEALLRLSRGGGMPIDLPGQRMERVGSDVVLTGRRKGGRGRSDSAAAPTPNLFRYPLSIPGEVWIAEAGGLVSAELAAQQPRAGAAVGSHRVGPGEDVAIVQFPPHPGPLAVRNRRPGDRFRPLGLGGTKKVQDYFVDRKVARNLRDSVPLVVDAADRIVWVAGHAIDERFRVIDPAQAVVVLRLRQV